MGETRISVAVLHEQKTVFCVDLQQKYEVYEVVEHLVVIKRVEVGTMGTVVLGYCRSMSLTHISRQIEFIPDKFLKHDELSPSAYDTGNSFLSLYCGLFKQHETVSCSCSGIVVW